MNTYFIKTRWGNEDTKITVDDEVRVTINGYGEDGKQTVAFYEPRINYADTLLAAYTDVDSVRRDDVDIQYKEVEYDDEPEARTDREAKVSWIDASKKSEDS